MDGITGCYSPGDRDLMQKIFLATGAVQHRGKASGGVAVGGRKGIHIHKGIGAIADVVEEETLRIFQSALATSTFPTVEQAMPGQRVPAAYLWSGSTSRRQRTYTSWCTRSGTCLGLNIRATTQDRKAAHS